MNMELSSSAFTLMMLPIGGQAAIEKTVAQLKTNVLLKDRGELVHSCP
jgi:hypothetical protein